MISQLIRPICLFLFLAIQLHSLNYSVLKQNGCRIHVLDVDLEQETIELIPFGSPFAGVGKLSVEAKARGALAGVNGGFFQGDPNYGAPSGIFVYQGERITPTDRTRGAIGWNDGFTDVLIDRLDSASDEGDPLSAELIPIFHPENKEIWNQMKTILGSTPLLIMDGKRTNRIEEEQTRQSFLDNRYPRTAIGLIGTDRCILVMVEGIQSGHSQGMSIPELAIFMESLGVDYALNLDGGRSSTLYYKGKVIHSSGMEGEDIIGDSLLGERKVGNVLLVFAKDKA